MTAPNGGEPVRGRSLTESVSCDEPQSTSKLSREEGGVSGGAGRCVTNATLAGDLHAVASTDLRVLDPHIALMRPANDRPFADHVRLDRGTRLGAALQHDGRWYNAFKAAHGSASSTSVANCSLRARCDRVLGGATERGRN